MHAAILLAAGSGKRMGSSISDKLLHPIGSTTAFRLSCEAFLRASTIELLILVFRDEPQKEKIQREFELATAKAQRRTPFLLVKGGKERQYSVSHALSACDPSFEFVQVHDCARPMIRPETIDRLAREVVKSGAIAVARPLSDSIRKTFQTSQDPAIPQKTECLDRSNLWLMETPQATRRDWLVDGLRKAEKQGLTVTDELSIIELNKRKVAFHNPDYPNPKITKESDLAYIQYLLEK
jgi:2-C-methyl-D-erythritol 4-phosphate cytidylyltransferase